MAKNLLYGRTEKKLGKITKGEKYDVANMSLYAAICGDVGKKRADAALQAAGKAQIICDARDRLAEARRLRKEKTVREEEVA